MTLDLESESVYKNRMKYMEHSSPGRNLLGKILSKMFSDKRHDLPKGLEHVKMNEGDIKIRGFDGEVAGWDESKPLWDPLPPDNRTNTNGFVPKPYEKLSIVGKYTREYDIHTHVEWYDTLNTAVTMTYFLNYVVRLEWEYIRDEKTRELRALVLKNLPNVAEMVFNPRTYLATAVSLFLEEAYDVGKFESVYKDAIIDRRRRHREYPVGKLEKKNDG